MFKLYTWIGKYLKKKNFFQNHLAKISEIRYVHVTLSSSP